MKHYFRTISLLLCAIPLSSYAMMAPVDETTPMSPYYKFDKKQVRDYIKSKTSSLHETTCPRDELLSMVGLPAQQGRKWTSLSYEDTETNMMINVDVAGCSFSGYPLTYPSQEMTAITPSEALQKAKDFLATVPLLQKATVQIGNPEIVNSFTQSPIPMPMMTATTGSLEKIDDPQQTQYTILFPYIIDGKTVYFQYGGKMGITVEVNKNGVVSYNGVVLVIGQEKNATRLTTSQAFSLLTKGGNSPYRGSKRTIQFLAPKDAYIYFNYWKNNTSKNYITSAFVMSSRIPQENGFMGNYETTIADYGFANPSLPRKR